MRVWDKNLGNISIYRLFSDEETSIKYEFFDKKVYLRSCTSGINFLLLTATLSHVDFLKSQSTPHSTSNSSGTWSKCTEQSSVPYPLSQVHVPFPHSPCPLQSLGQRFFSTSVMVLSGSFSTASSHMSRIAVIAAPNAISLSSRILKQ